MILFLRCADPLLHPKNPRPLIWFNIRHVLAYNDFFLSTTGFDKSTLSTTGQRVTNAHAARADTFIKWPSSTSLKSSNKTGFYLAAGFLNVIGCINGTHVRIQAPSADVNAFVNPLGYHSIDVERFCDYGHKKC